MNASRSTLFLLLPLMVTLQMKGIAAPQQAESQIPDEKRAINPSERPLAKNPFNEKAILAVFSQVEGKVERYKVLVNKGWLDKNRLSVTITAEVVNASGERKTISRNAIAVFKDGQQCSLTVE